MMYAFRRLKLVVPRGQERGMQVPGVFALALVLLQASAFADTAYPTAGTQFGQDDYNLSTVFPMFSVVYSPGFPPTEYGWVMTALNGWEAGQASNISAGASTAYTFQWASSTQMIFVDAGITPINYDAWVVSEPSVTSANGTNFEVNPKLSGNNNVNDVGGAVINLQYVPIAPIPPWTSSTNLGWIQVYQGSRVGVPEAPTVDTPSSSLTPFYPSNASGASSIVWLEDRPFLIEPEAADNLPNEGNPLIDETYITLLAGENLVGNTEAVTLYGGVEWGLTYKASDTPEPSTFALFGIGAASLIAYGRRMRRETVRKNQRII